MNYKSIFLFGFIFLFVFTSLNLSAEMIDDQKLQNLEAFAKLYGYVRFFHPSDNAADVNWDKFAILGSAEVIKAKNTDELKIILQKLFLPIAPTVQIYKTGTEKPVPPKNPESTEGLNLVAWQHRGVGLGWDYGYLMYNSIRIHRVTEKELLYNQFWTNILRDKIKSADIKMLFKAKLIPENQDTYAFGYLDQVSRNGGDKYKSSEKIEPSAWKDYEVTLKLDEKYNYLQPGFLIIGDGELLIDDVQVFCINEKGEKIPIEIFNSDFEKPMTSDNETWYMGDMRSTIVIKQEGEEKKNSVLSIKPEKGYLPGALFKEVPAAGETFIKPINDKLSCMVPLSLWSKDGKTIDEVDEEIHTKLKEALDKIDLKTTNSSSDVIRYADVIILWNVFQHFYPYFDVIEVNWDRVLKDTLNRAINDKTEHDFLYTLSSLVEKLYDGHGNVSNPKFADKYCFPFIADLIEDQVVIVKVGDTKDLKVGDIILEVNGEKATDRFNNIMRYISGSPQWKRYKAARWYFYLSPEPDEVKLKIQRGDEIKELKVVPFEISPKSPMLMIDRKKTDKINDDIYYVNLSNTTMDEINKILPELAKSKGVIFDLRGYPRGNHEIISHLIDKPVKSAIWNIPQIIYPDQEKIVGWNQSGRWVLLPKEPRLKGKIVFLTNANAISYAESFMGIIENYKLAEIIGEQTAGTNGNVNALWLPGGYYVRFTGMKVLKHDGSQHHLIGITPTIPLSRTIKAVREGRDEVLEKAIEVINSQK